ncbi:MAG: SIMPL domain-containing protein [Deltaproteobacteria bacterium]|nr:SIMPL domain-containing protein [Deltaproteobacteria bacterium]
MMKELLRKGVIAFVLVVVFSCLACTRERPQPRLITVTGEAEVRVTPDEITLALGVETWHKELSIAKRQNDERVKKVFALAKRYNVAPGNFWTDRVSVEPRYKGGDSREELIGYVVRKTIVFTVRDISRLDDLLNSVLDAGANYIYGVQFGTTKLRDYRDQARALALKAAKEKAKDMSKELGQKVGRPYSIVEEEYETGTAPNVTPGTGVSFREADKSIALGQMSIGAKVRVSFELR